MVIILKVWTEFLADFAEFLYDDIGVLAGELAAGSKKVAKVYETFFKRCLEQYLLLVLLLLLL